MLEKINNIAVLAAAGVMAMGAFALAGCSESNSNANTNANTDNTENVENANTETTSNDTNDGAAANAGNEGDNAASNANKEAPNVGPTSGQKNMSGEAYVDSTEKGDKYAQGKHHVTMTVEGYDPIKIELDGDAAPITVSNFCRLAENKFYDGLNFYRFQEGFCMQGGSSNNGAAIVADGLLPIKGEFSTNNVKNKLADNFKKGTIAMARSSDPNSATSTFFVTLDSSDMVSQALDGNYAAFGTIDEDGMKVVDKIVSDYLDAVDDASGMGMIQDVDKQAKITSIVVND